jgi:hypothetical protein
LLSRHFGPVSADGIIVGIDMGDVVNLRMARKRAARSKEETAAAENRMAHGVSRREKDMTEAQRQAADSKLDGHRIEPGESR